MSGQKVKLYLMPNFNIIIHSKVRFSDKLSEMKKWWGCKKMNRMIKVFLLTGLVLGLRDLSYGIDYYVDSLNGLDINRVY
ncbi:MAG: hypothetical protein AB1349_14270 [Elusimicrobiota bacterium]